MIKLKKFFTITLIFVVITSIFLSILIFYTLWKFSPDIPSYEKIINYKPSLSSRVYSSDGLLLKSFYVEERIFIPVDRIPNNIKKAFISAEDKNFYKHKGIDLLAIMRAFVTNLANISSDKRVVGASTITQQVVKNLLLTNEVSYKRKIKEIILAIRIENILSKDKILELYLNDIYLGYGSYGIGTASLNYFNKSIDQLKLHEIAFLAALPKAPNNYNPITNYENAIKRRNWVIERLYQNKYIVKKDLEYKNYPIEVFKRTENNFTGADYYFEEIRKDLYNKFGKNKLYSEGLIVKSSINTTIQNFANQSLIEGIINYDKSQGWKGILENVKPKTFKENKSKYEKINPFNDKWKIVRVLEKKNNTLIAEDLSSKTYQIDLTNDENKWLLNQSFNKGDVFFIEDISSLFIIRQIPSVNGGIIVINPHNGDVLALSGGFSFKLSEFNRVTQAKRQPGSAFKPFVYITALNEGYTPSTLILDAPYVVDQGAGLPKWKPANYSEEFYGLTTMRTGIEKSRNLMTVRLAHKLGMEKIINTVNLLGIKDGINNQLSMSLGSGLVTLKDITSSYAMIANGGFKLEPKIIKSIYSKNGKKIYASDIKKCENCNLTVINKNISIPKIKKTQEQVINSKIAYQITSMMEGVIERGTAKRLKDLDVPIAGKTGTTNDNKDAWFIGYTPNLVVGVYIGHDKPKSLGFKQTGSSVAVPIFKLFAKKSKMNSKKIPFRVPSGISFVRIDPKTGLSSNSDSSILEPYVVGTEPYAQNINIIDTFGDYKNNSISGTGGLLK